ncbi:hypothetical protein OBBRIDRAFT_762638 [Obba rivulosa]|uniref:Uncharacterized protein n=1 Tax=Obba rivulosa TaxID=1052685 RepID=A0A8E2DG75_9APHY|nr:hypothetical protein OBBRIDRAFT_762638 [Obba rivulosa]
MFPLLPPTLVFLSWALHADAGNVTFGNSCSLSDQRLEEGTYQFQTDCDSVTFCNSSSLCDLKGCRRDDFPFGYSVGQELPPKCPTGQFCPDEEDACQEVLPVGSPCQFNRDDECEGPPNWRDLADRSGYGLNVNGSVCLNNICMWANMTAGQQCIVQNTAYVGYGKNTEFVDIVSRGNCKIGLYCDSQSLACMQTKDIGVSCDADKECSTYNCLASGVCGPSANTPSHVATWVYIVVGVCIFGGMIGTLVGLYFFHRKNRDSEREKRHQYWREQNAFRQHIMQMQETARNSLLYYTTPGNNSPRSTMYSRDGAGSDDSHMPMLHAASKASGLRYHISDEDGSSESLVMQRKEPSQF